MSTETTAACVMGCTMYRNHLAECEHTEDDECRGCLPRRARNGLFCDTCHRRFELMIFDAPTVIRWLTGNMGDGGYERDREPEKGRIRYYGARHYPAPLKVQIADHRDLIRDRLALWVDHWCEHKGLTGPEKHTPEIDSAFLLTWLPGICRLEWVGDWWTEMAETMSEAHSMAPWRPAVRRLPGVPCPGCGETNLMIYGGESDVCCGSCRIMMTEDRFELWQRVLKQDEEAEAS